MRAVRLPLSGADLVIPALGAALILFASFASVRVGAEFGLGLALAISFFLIAVTAFAVLPHLAVAATIPLFALLPTVKALSLPTIGAVKEFGGTFTIPTDGVRERVTDVPRFVSVKGGAYFFLPGLAALRYLAGMAGEPGNSSSPVGS